MVLATRTLVDAALPLLKELGEEAGAQELVSHEGPATAEMWDARIALVQSLGDRRMEIYVGPDALGLVLPAEELPEDIQSRAGRFAQEITRTPGFSESLLPYLERLTQPALLIKGGHDPVTSPEEIDQFHAKVPNGRSQLFDTAGHFVHAEQPGAYARLVTDFILGSLPPHDGTGRTAGSRPTARTEEQAVQPRGKSG